MSGSGEIMTFYCLVIGKDSMYFAPYISIYEDMSIVHQYHVRKNL